MSRITGTIEIDFDTEKPISKEQFKAFKNKLNEYLGNAGNDKEKTFLRTQLYHLKKINCYAKKKRTS